MTSSLPGLRVQPAAATGSAPSRRSFLRYTGASAALGSLWLASCKKDNEPVARPTITGFTPTSGMAGTTVTVTGTRFTGATAVLLGSINASFTVLSDTSLTFVVPTGAPTGLIVVGTPSGPISTADPFTVTTTPVSAPGITSVSPASALPGATVTVTGTNFTGVTALMLNDLPATPTIVSTTTITFVVPAAAQAGAANIIITGPGGRAANNTVFTVLPTTVSVGTGDAGVLNYAYALEQLEAAFYTTLRTGTYYTGLSATSAERLILDDLYYHEVIHRDFFKTAITAAGATPLKALTTNFSTINFNDRTAVLSAARAFEDLGVAAYNGAGQYIQSPAYLYLAGKIVSVEARHAAIIRDLVSENTFVGNDVITLASAGTSSVTTNNAPANSSLERALSPAEVVAIANTFLADGSKLDVSGIR